MANGLGPVLPSQGSSGAEFKPLNKSKTKLDNLSSKIENAASELASSPRRAASTLKRTFSKENLKPVGDQFSPVIDFGKKLVRSVSHASLPKLFVSKEKITKKTEAREEKKIEPKKQEKQAKAGAKEKEKAEKVEKKKVNKMTPQEIAAAQKQQSENLTKRFSLLPREVKLDSLLKMMAGFKKQNVLGTEGFLREEGKGQSVLESQKKILEQLENRQPPVLDEMHNTDVRNAFGNAFKRFNIEFFKEAANRPGQLPDKLTPEEKALFDELIAFGKEIIQAQKNSSHEKKLSDVGVAVILSMAFMPDITDPFKAMDTQTALQKQIQGFLNS